MTHRERALAVLHGETPDIIPSLGECAMDVTCVKGFAPEPTGDAIQDEIRAAEFYDNSAVGLGGGFNIGLKVETISRSSDHHLYRYETGAVWRESYQPTFCREAVEYPINQPADLDRFAMPAVRGAGEEEAMKRRVKAFHEAGYFVQGGAMGAWYGIYYFLTRFENILMWMVTEPDAARRLFKLTADYSLREARNMLKAGVDAIFTASDLGSGQGLLFSRDLFQEHVFPWLKELADLCHQHGAILHLHSHGHIQDLMDGIVASAVDLLNPVGPSDYNDLALFKQKWGHRITLMGGISTTIANMTVEQIDRHVAEVMRVGCQGGRFIPRTESGIPMMPAEKVRAYLDILKKYRRQYGRGG